MTSDKQTKRLFKSTSADHVRDNLVIFVDADNTLWDTDKVFADAQLELLQAVEDTCGAKVPTSERLGFIRSIDQELAARHHLGLRYPPRLLVLALSLMLQGRTVEESAKKAWVGSTANGRISDQAIETIQSRYFEDLAKTPPLLRGVKLGLSKIDKSGAKILVLTEGHKKRVVRTAQLHGVMQFIDRVIEAKKDSRLFERVLRLVGAPEIAVMIGDQVTKDIIPASQAGLRTIYIPGGFRPKWEETESKDLVGFQVDSFAEVPKIIDRLSLDAGLSAPTTYRE